MPVEENTWPKERIHGPEGVFALWYLLMRKDVDIKWKPKWTLGITLWVYQGLGSTHLAILESLG